MVRVKQKIYWVIGLCIVSLAGLFVSQLVGVKSTLSLVDERYNHNVTVALNKLSAEYTRLAQWQADTTKHRLSVVPDSAFDKVLLDSLLKQYATENRLSHSYEYSIVQVLDSTAVAANVEALAGCYRVPIKPALYNSTKVAAAYQLQVVFPDKVVNVTAGMWWWMSLALGFMLAVAISLVFIIRSIVLQKRRSVEQSDFINSMIHELKTPIATVAMSSKVLKEAGKSVTSFDKLRSYAEIVDDENKRIMACVESLLQTLTINKRTLSLHREWIDVTAMIRSTVESFTVARRLVRFDLRLDETIKNIYADKMHMRGVFDNLIDNAIKYSQTESCVIHIQTELEGSNVVIMIEDNGKGMNAREAKHAFDKFYRSSSVKKRGIKGFGLGLFYVKQVVEAHGGRVFIKSMLNKGTTVGVILPVDK